MPTIVIDPVTRLEGHLKVQVDLDQRGPGARVVEARATGTLFRGLETILQGRVPNDAIHITERICGVCPVSHGMASSLALEDAARSAPAAAGVHMRNLVLAANFLQSHLLHFYHLSLPDYLDGPPKPPWQPTWSVDRRFTATQAQPLLEPYVRALEMRRKAHERGALVGGRLPHPPSFVAGGITTSPRAERIDAFGRQLDELQGFVETVYLPDVELWARTYPELLENGRGYGNLLAYGAFVEPDGTALFPRGRSEGGGPIQPIALDRITEQVSHSWYADSTGERHPSEGATVPVSPETKPSAYSWLKAPRYAGAPYEVGPLARMYVSGDHTRGISVGDRHLARAKEAAKLIGAMRSWLGRLRGGESSVAAPKIPAAASGVGLTEAPRGALGHWLRIDRGSIARYQVITPTCWNLSPQDGAGVRGPLEQALIGGQVSDPTQPVEIVRVIHSFDPCLSCAVHVMVPKREAQVLHLGMA